MIDKKTMNAQSITLHLSKYPKFCKHIHNDKDQEFFSVSNLSMVLINFIKSKSKSLECLVEATKILKICLGKLGNGSVFALQRITLIEALIVEALEKYFNHLCRADEKVGAPKEIVCVVNILFVISKLSLLLSVCIFMMLLIELLCIYIILVSKLCLLYFCLSLRNGVSSAIFTRCFSIVVSFHERMFADAARTDTDNNKLDIYI